MEMGHVTTGWKTAVAAVTAFTIVVWFGVFTKACLMRGKPQVQPVASSAPARPAAVRTQGAQFLPAGGTRSAPVITPMPSPSDSFGGDTPSDLRAVQEAR